MRFLPIRTSPLLPPRDNVFAALDSSLPKLREGDILFITSKVLAIHQGLCVKIAPGVSKKHLIEREAEMQVPRRPLSFKEIHLTIKEHTLIPSAGIDESNGNGYYILWPRRINVLLGEIRSRLQKKFNIKKLAVVATDSHTTPLRMGVTGVSIGSVGMEPVRDCRGAPDIFGRKLKYTKINVVDALVATAVLLMGEGSEQTPFLVLRGAKCVTFINNKSARRRLFIPAGKDLYAPLLRVFKKNKRA